MFEKLFYKLEKLKNQLVLPKFLIDLSRKYIVYNFLNRAVKPFRGIKPELGFKVRTNKLK